MASLEFVQRLNYPSRDIEAEGRRHPVHFPVREQHNTPIIVFLTVWTKDKKQILDQAAVHDLLIDSWKTRPSWLVGRYVIMPDHIHLFCAPAESIPQPLVKWINFWKSLAAQHWPSADQLPAWQRHFWDTQLRRHESYSQKWDYVVQNPVRAKLVMRPEEWPYQGELDILRW